MTKSAATNNTSESSNQDKVDDAVIADNATLDTNAESQPKAVKKSHGVRSFILLVCLIALAVLGSLALSGKLTPLYESLTAGLHHLSVQQQAPKKTMAVAKPDDVKAVPVPEKPTVVSHPGPEPESALKLQSTASPESTPTPEPTSAVQPAAVSTEEVRTLLSSIDALRDQLQQMSDAQQALQNGLKEQQQMDLQVRLRWISDPASRLPQLQLAWEEISLLPGLSDSQRSEAVRMHALARARVQQLKQWQDALSKWADALVTPVHRNILPEPPYPWLAWIVNQFQLRQAPSVEARHLGNLRARLFDAARHLTLESWPKKGAWQSLQAELLLQIRAMDHDAGGEDSVVETGLPESFDAIQADIITLRHTARQWQHGGGQ